MCVVVRVCWTGLSVSDVLAVFYRTHTIESFLDSFVVVPVDVLRDALA